MSSNDDINKIAEWARAVSQSRETILSGSPLWAYKITDIELNSLKDLFYNLFISNDPNSIFIRYTDLIDRSFVMYISTWLQRNHVAGRPTWSNVLDSIALNETRASRSNITDAVESGLKKWRINVFATEYSNRYLDTLYCHGGFPRSDLLDQSHSSLMDYFESVLHHYAGFRYEENLESIAYEDLDKLPVTLRQKPFVELTVKLIEHLIELRDDYHLYSAKDPFETLVYKNPNWQNDIPFLIVDEEATRLINKLLRRTSKLVRRFQNPVRIKRYLSQKNDSFRLYSEVYVNHTIHPEDLHRVLRTSKLPNFFDLYTITDNNLRQRTASFTFRSGDAKRWQVSTHLCNFSDHEAFGEIRYEICSDGKTLDSDIYYRGEKMDGNLPWAFVRGNSTLDYFCQGGVKTNQSEVFIVSQLPPLPCDNFTTIVNHGKLQGFERDVFKIVGHAKIPSKVGYYHFKTSAETNQNFTAILLGKEFTKALSSSSIFLGTPDVQATVSDEVLTDIDDEFFWLSEKGAELIPLQSEKVVGSGSVVWLHENELLWEKKCIVLPPHFDVEVIHIEDSNLELKLINAGDCKIGMPAGNETWMTDEPMVIGEFHLCEFKLPDLMTESLEIQIYWDNNRATLTNLTFQTQIDSVTLTDRHNLTYRTLQSGNLCMNDLPQMKAWILSKDPLQRLTAKAQLLISGGKKIASCSADLNYSGDNGTYIVVGRDLANLAARLLRHGRSLDSSVKFTFYGNEGILSSELPEVAKYKHNPKVNMVTGKITIDRTPLSESSDNSHLFISPMWDLSREPLVISPNGSSNNFVWEYDIPEVKDYGPWLIWGSKHASIHPRSIIFEVPAIQLSSDDLGSIGQQLREVLKVTESEFQEVSKGSVEHAVKFLKYDPEEHKFDFREMREIVLSMGQDPNHDAWNYVEGILSHIDEIEPSTFHFINAITVHYSTLTMMLLRRDETFETVWSMAEKLPFEWYEIPFFAWQLSIKTIHRETSKSLSSIAVSHPELYEDLINQRFSLLRDKGEYFSTLIELSINSDSKGFLSIWPDNSNSELDYDKTISHQLKQAKQALYEKHEHKLLANIQTNKWDKFLIEGLEETWPRNSLDTQLAELIPKLEDIDARPWKVIKAQQLTIALPLKTSFNNMGLFETRLQKNNWSSLRIALTELQEFDREWLQISMALGMRAAFMVKNNPHQSDEK